jgi:uncharacterized protein YcbX
VDVEDVERRWIVGRRQCIWLCNRRSMQVTQINVYPVKSCRGVSAPRGALRPDGLRFDREWMVVTAENGKSLTARKCPRLLLVMPTLPPGAVESHEWMPKPEDAMCLEAPGMEPLLVPLAAPPSSSTRTVNVWEWTGEAHDEGDAAAEWFSRHAGQPCRLVR